MPDRLVLLSIPQLLGRIVTPGGLESLDALAGRGAKVDLEPAFPGLAASSFATLVTGLGPAQHGIIGNTYFDRERRAIVRPPLPDSACQAPKLWERLAAARPSARTLLWFAPNTQGARVNLCGRVEPDGRIVTEPAPLADTLVAQFGPLPGPGGPSGEPPRLATTAWLLRTAAAVIAAERPELSIVRVPYLGQVARRFGPDGREANRAILELNSVLKPFLAALPAETAVLAVTESVTTPVSGPIEPNRVLRAMGLLRLTPAPGGGLDVDLAASPAFAVADHQLCHVYLNDPAQAATVAAAFSGDEGDGIATVAPGSRRAALGLDHPRAGDVVLVAEPDRWFSADWWQTAAEAPDPARCPSGLRFARPLVPIDPAHVRGSLGAPTPSPTYLGVAIASDPHILGGRDRLASHDLLGHILKYLGS